MEKTNLPNSIELFLFDFCPFAQRVQMSLILSGLPFKKIIMDPKNIPDDFSSISPLGNVPVLRIDNQHSIFESAVINDYIAQISPVALAPNNALETAQMRAWSEYCGGCMGALMQVLQAETAEGVTKANKALIEKFTVISKILSQQSPNQPYFYGEQLTTIDTTYAPLFLRMQTLSDLYDDFSIDALPENIAKWMQAVLNTDALQESIIGDFPKVYRAFISRKAAGKLIDSQL